LILRESPPLQRSDMFFLSISVHFVYRAGWVMTFLASSLDNVETGRRNSRGIEGNGHIAHRARREDELSWSQSQLLGSVELQHLRRAALSIEILRSSGDFLPMAIH